MHRLAILVLGASIVGGCGTGASPGRSPSPAAIPTAVAVVDCPFDSPLSVAAFVTADPSCFGSDVDVRGWLGPPPSIGWEAPFVVKPWAWPEQPWVLWQRGPGGDAMCGGDDDCHWLALNVFREARLDFGDRARWVIVTGHRMDPESETCHWDAPGPSVEAARDECRADFVISSIVDAP